jgi:hypothetical protein
MTWQPGAVKNESPIGGTSAIKIGPDLLGAINS